MSEDLGPPKIDPIPGTNNNPNPDNPGRWNKPKKQGDSETPSPPPPVSGQFLPGITNPPPGSGGELDVNGIISGAQDFLTTHQDQIVQGLLIGGALLGLAGAVITAPLWLPAAGAALAGLSAAGGALAGALGGTGGLVAAGTAAAIAAPVILGSGGAQAAETHQYQRDPLLLDLNGDGIKTIDFRNGVFFDHDNNGFAEWSTWVDDNDGVLAVDLNNNGKIDNGTELFGDGFILPNGSHATHGYEALRTYDSNADGVVNSSDQNFSQLKVLKGDGTLLTLQQSKARPLIKRNKKSKSFCPKFRIAC